MTCVGAACDAVEIVWDEAACAYRILNRSVRLVRVVLYTLSGAISLRIEPHGAADLHTGQFELPYEATFID